MIGVAVVLLAVMNVVGVVSGTRPTASVEQQERLQPATSAPALAGDASFDAFQAEAEAETATAALAVPGLPAGSALPEIPADVVVHRPALRLPAGADPAAVAAAIAQVPGVASTAAIEVTELPVPTVDGGTDTLTVAAVDPLAFRPLTPEITADEPAVWERLLAGEGAVTHEVGHRFSPTPGFPVSVGDDATLRIGAFASNGIPPVADAVVSQETARALGLQGQTELLIAAEPGTDAATLAQQIAEVTGVAPQVIEQPVQQRAFLTGNEAQSFFEPFSYVDHGDGMITIDPDWVAGNIVRTHVPIFTGEVVCHRQYIEQLVPALQAIVDQGLAHLIDTTQYGGCWVPRHIDWSPDRPLSMHSWGLALDLNVSTNQLGQTPTLDMRIVQIMESYGFAWGGRWSRPDGMHFELAAVMTGVEG